MKVFEDVALVHVEVISEVGDVIMHVSFQSNQGDIVDGYVDIKVFISFEVSDGEALCKDVEG